MGLRERERERERGDDNDDNDEDEEGEKKRKVGELHQTTNNKTSRRLSWSVNLPMSRLGGRIILISGCGRGCVLLNKIHETHNATKLCHGEDEKQHAAAATAAAAQADSQPHGTELGQNLHWVQRE